ncbi:MAG: T9SS type A sorting domain-containing protein [Flavobacterium sp.]|nr:MAG: T9SS type A sorting domain-containing protein [Flavobacterium sp.]
MLIVSSSETSYLIPHTPYHFSSDQRPATNVYFDFNFPIVTNTATTTIQQLQVSDFEFASQFTLYPVPTKNILNIESKNGVEVRSVSIYNMLGQLLQVESGSVSAVDISTLERGTYFLKIHSSKGNAVTRFVKE